MNDAAEHRDLRLRDMAPLVAVVVVCALLEAILFLADLDVIDAPRLRQVFYDYGGFWPGLLDSWRPNYAAQPVTMFVTYGFLHGGPVHLLVNMFTLYSLGQAVVDRSGNWGFVEVYGASLLGGAMLYGVLAESFQPMVGASGALFGLAGALVAWNLAERITLRDELGPIMRVVALLIIINLVMWWALNGQLAWQTHLGGFLAGFSVALWSRPDTSPGETP